LIGNRAVADRVLCVVNENTENVEDLSQEDNKKRTD